MVMPVYDRRGNELLHGMPVGGGILEKTAGKTIGKGVRMAGDAVRSAFGGGAITGDMAGRAEPTEQMTIGNPMAAPTAADMVKMPQDLQLGYLHLNRFGSPLPVHGLATPGRTSIANMMQDQNFAAYHRAILGARNPVGMSRVPFGLGGVKVS
tara:strand:- start:3 stop:461 length:459 start_codon:yes stop_codon:yes gene_type:complete